MFVEEQTGNITYDITGFKRIEIHDDMADARIANPETEDTLYSIRVCFGFADSASFITLGRYIRYEDAASFYNELINKLAGGAPFATLVPQTERGVLEL